MALKLRYESMPKDDLVWEENDEQEGIWEKSINKNEILQAIGKLILKFKPGDAEVLHRPLRGGYNVVWRLDYKDGSSAALRIPIKGIKTVKLIELTGGMILTDLGAVRFADEKVRYEVATMRYIAERTTIPVPTIYHWGTAADNPTGLGPFIIMEYIEHEMTMSDALTDPALEPGDPHVLDPSVSEQKLEVLYRQMANVLLQLSTLTFPRIGSLVEHNCALRTFDQQGSSCGRCNRLGICLRCAGSVFF